MLLIYYITLQAECQLFRVIFCKRNHTRIQSAVGYSFAPICCNFVGSPQTEMRLPNFLLSRRASRTTRSAVYTFLKFLTAHESVLFAESINSVFTHDGQTASTGIFFGFSSSNSARD